MRSPVGSSYATVDRSNLPSISTVAIRKRNPPLWFPPFQETEDESVGTGSFYTLHTGICTMMMVNGFLWGLCSSGINSNWRPAGGCKMQPTEPAFCTGEKQKLCIDFCFFCFILGTLPPCYQAPFVWQFMGLIRCGWWAKSRAVRTVDWKWSCLVAHASRARRRCWMLKRWQLAAARAAMTMMRYRLNNVDMNTYWQTVVGERTH